MTFLFHCVKSYFHEKYQSLILCTQYWSIYEKYFLEPIHVKVKYKIQISHQEHLYKNFPIIHVLLMPSLALEVTTALILKPL